MAIYKDKEGGTGQQQVQFAVQATISSRPGGFDDSAGARTSCGA